MQRLRFFVTGTASTTCGIAVGLLLISWIGCGSANRPPSRANDPALKTLLAYYDQHYDADEQLLRVEFSSPGYHSKVSSGTLVHPTRESLFYALALLQRGADGDADRAGAIARRVLDLQNSEPRSRTCGVWPWLLEEPLDKMASPDLNWADFCGMQIAHMLAEHSDQLPATLRTGMRESLRLAAEAIRRRDVGPSYTNIAILGGGVCAVAGELLDDQDLLEYGRQRLQKVVQHTARHGSFNEYNSPPYVKVVIAECERTLALVRDPATREAAESLRSTAWEIAAGSFHPGTQQWAGPHSRTSRDRLRWNTASFLSRRVGVEIEPHPTMIGGEPRGDEVVRPLPCPESLVARFKDSPAEPIQLQRTFVRGKSEDDSTIGTTWLSADACLGSVNQSTFWTQRKPIIAYWKTDDEPAVVFRVRFLHEGKDFASMAVRALQDGPRVLCAFHAVPDSGDWHPSLDRPANGIFQATEFRLRCELRGNNVNAVELGDGRYALRAGEHRIVIHTSPSHFDGHEVQWQIGSDGDSVFLDGICFSGRQQPFDFRNSLNVNLAIGIELLKTDESPAASSPTTFVSEAGHVDASWMISETSTLSVRASN